LFSGSAEVAYPIPGPAAAAGPEPSIAFVYSSGNVDGLVKDENTQVSTLGVGWSLAGGGSIHRSLEACNETANGVNAVDDKCLIDEPDEAYTLSVAGHSSRLVRTDTGGYPHEFRLESDPFWRIQLWRGTPAAANGQTLSTPDAEDEWWSVETPDGLVYTFGTTERSVDWVPVRLASDATQCVSTATGQEYGSCDRAYRWNLDSVTDTFGNQMTYEYAQETNYYNLRGQYKSDYIRASRLEAVEYGANPGLSRPANARIDLVYEWRCANSATFSKCTQPIGGDGSQDEPTQMYDVPLEFWCGPLSNVSEYDSVCTESAPTFWSQMRLAGALSQVGAGTDGGDGWVTVANHDPGQSYVRDDNASYLDSSLQPVMDRIRERPIQGVAGPGNIGEYEDWGLAPLYAVDFDAEGGTIASGDVIIVNDATDVGTETAVASVHDEDWITFDDVYVGDPAAPSDQFILRASAFREGTVEVWIDATMPSFGSPYGTQPTGGTKIGEVTFSADDLNVNRRDFQTFVIELDQSVSGVHDVSLRASGANQQFFTFWNWGRFAVSNATVYANMPEVGEVRFRDANGWAWHDNRRNHAPATGASAMRFPRMQTFINQLAGRVDYVYGHSAGMECEQDEELPNGIGSWAENRRNCFPQFDDSTGNPGFTIFQKWPVIESTRSGQVTAAGGGGFEYAPDIVTTYNYKDAGWAAEEGPLWNSFRGYQTVQVTDSAGTTEHRFYQGLKGEESQFGLTSPFSTVVRSDGQVLQDEYWLKGMPYETRRLASPSSNDSLERQWTSYYADTTHNTMSDRRDPRFVAPSETHAFVNPNAAFTFYAETLSEYEYNDWGQVTGVRNLGRPSITADDQTIDTLYYDPTDTNPNLGTWRGPMPCVVGVDKDNVSKNPTSPSSYQRWTVTYYDNTTSYSCNRTVAHPVPTASAVPRWSSASNGSLLRTEFDLDTRGRVVAVTSEKDATENGATPTSQTVYHPYHGQVITTKNDLLWESSTGYDRWRRPTTSTDVNGRITTTTYDEYSRVDTVTEPVDQIDGVPTVRLTYEQDTYPAYVQTETRLDGSDYTNSVSFVDGFGRAIQTQTLAPETDQMWATAMAYDDVGRVSRTSNQFGLAGNDPTVFNNIDWGTVDSFVEQQYDAQSRLTYQLTKRGDGAGNQTATFWTERWTYNHYWTTYYDRKNQRTLTYSDGRGRTLRTRELGAGIGGANLDTVFGYNGADDLTQVTAPDGEITQIWYDRIGRKTKMQDPDSGEWLYWYNINSNLTKQRDPSGTETNFVYDDLDRLTIRRYREGTTGGWTDSARWYYDPTGNLGALRWTRSYNQDNGASNAEVRRFYYYDVSTDPADLSTGRLIRERTQIPRNDGSTSRWSFDTEYTYRPDGQYDTIKYPTSTGGASNETVTYGYDTRTGLPNTLNSGLHGQLVDGVERNGAGQLTSRMYGNQGASGVVTFEYDPNTLRLTTNQAGTTGAPDAWQHLEYRYDKNDNITKIRDYGNASQWQCFAYDQIDRLTRAWTANAEACPTGTNAGVGNYDETYTYSNGGNINTRDGAVYTYGENGASDHAVTTIVDGAATSTFEYDANGDMTVRNIAGQPDQTLNWDPERRLDTVTANGQTTNMTVDAEGARVRRDDGTTYTYYLPHGVQYERNGTQGTFTHYYSHSGAMVAFAETGDDPTFIFSDHINSTTVTNDGTGPKTQRYTPWGETRTNGGLDTDHTYTGQIDDPTTGLKYYNARYYDPAIGRFVSPDPIVPSAGNGQDYNRYTYVRNNPLAYDDPSGNEPRDWLKRVLLGAIVHRYIQAELMIKHQLQPEVGLQNGKRRADLVDTSVGGVYEIKPDNDAGRTLGRSSIAAFVSVVNAAGAVNRDVVVPRCRVVQCSPSVWAAGTRQFSVSIETSLGTISYRTVSGVIAYSISGNGEFPSWEVLLAESKVASEVYRDAKSSFVATDPTPAVITRPSEAPPLSTGWNPEFQPGPYADEAVTGLGVAGLAWVAFRRTFERMNPLFSLPIVPNPCSLESYSGVCSADQEVA